MNNKNLLNISTLKVYEEGRIWEYTLKYTEGGLPYYLAPREMQELHKKIYIDEILFLPVNNDIFDDAYKVYGYRFLFGSHGMNIEDDDTTMDLGFSVCRIRFITNPLLKRLGIDIIITHMGDSLFPVIGCKISADEEDMQEAINTMIMKLINTYTKFYLDRDI